MYEIHAYAMRVSILYSMKDADNRLLDILIFCLVVFNDVTNMGDNAMLCHTKLRIKGYRCHLYIHFEGTGARCSLSFLRKHTLTSNSWSSGTSDVRINLLHYCNWLALLLLLLPLFVSGAIHLVASSSSCLVSSRFLSASATPSPNGGFRPLEREGHCT